MLLAERYTGIRRKMSGRRFSYDAQFKLKVVRFSEQNGNRAAARHFERLWKKQKNELQATSGKRKAFRGKAAKYPRLEENALSYVNEQRSCGFAVTVDMIRFEAREEASRMGISRDNL